MALPSFAFRGVTFSGALRRVVQLGKPSTQGVGMAAEVEKRRYLRAEVSWPVTMLTASGPIEGEVRNISPGGAFVTCNAQPGLHETFRLVIKVPFERQYILAKGKVARSNLYDPDDRVLLRGVAVRFTEISEGDRELLNRVVAGRADASPG